KHAEGGPRRWPPGRPYPENCAHLGASESPPDRQSNAALLELEQFRLSSPRKRGPSKHRPASVFPGRNIRPGILGPAFAGTTAQSMALTLQAQRELYMSAHRPWMERADGAQGAGL